MNVSLMKNIPLVLASLALTSSAFAGDSDKVEMAHGRKGHELVSDRPDVDAKHGWTFGVSYIYQQARITGIEAAHTENDTVNSVPIDGRLMAAHPDMDSGFTIGLGKSFDHGEWDIATDFMFLRNKGNKTFSQSGSAWNESIIPDNIVTEGILDGGNIRSFTDGKFNTSSDFYKLQVHIMRGHFFNPNFSVQSGVGLHTNWIDIKGNNTYTDSTRATVYDNNRSKWWGIGPSTQTRAQYYLGQTGFSLLGEGNIAMLFGRMNVLQNTFYSTNSETNKAKMSNDHNDFSPHARGMLALKYDRDVMDCTQHIGLMIGLEAQTYWNQNQRIFAKNTTAIQYGTNPNNTFSPYGLKVSFEWAF